MRAETAALALVQTPVAKRCTVHVSVRERKHVSVSEREREELIYVLSLLLMV